MWYYVLMQTIVTPPLFSEDEYAIVRILSDDSSNKVADIQVRLVELFGDAIWLQQPPSLHITLMEIICDAKYYLKSRRKYFRDWQDSYSEIVKEVLSEIESFSIKFTELLVSERAIIVKTSDSTALNKIRELLLARIQLPPETKMPPDITHCSLARFNKVIDLKEAKLLLDEISIDITEHISGFSLVKNLGPLSFNSLPTESYLLK